MSTPLNILPFSGGKTKTEHTCAFIFSGVRTNKKCRILVICLRLREIFSSASSSSTSSPPLPFPFWLLSFHPACGRWVGLVRLCRMGRKLKMLHLIFPYVISSSGKIVVEAELSATACGQRKTRTGRVGAVVVLVLLMIKSESKKN